MPIGLFVDDRSSQAADTLLDSEDVHSIADSTEETANEQPEEVEQVEHEETAVGCLTRLCIRHSLDNDDLATIRDICLSNGMDTECLGI